MEELECPSIRKLKRTKMLCNHHFNSKKPLCAVYNAYKLKKWLIDHQNGIDYDHFQAVNAQPDDKDFEFQTVSTRKKLESTSTQTSDKDLELEPAITNTQNYDFHFNAPIPCTQLLFLDDDNDEDF